MLDVTANWIIKFPKFIACQKLSIFHGPS